MKKVLAITIAMLMVLGVFNGCSAENKMIEITSVNDEMKIPYTCDLDPEYGADSVERDGDHTDSPYFKAPDFYNMKPTESLTILLFRKISRKTCFSGITISRHFSFSFIKAKLFILFLSAFPLHF